MQTKNFLLLFFFALTLTVSASAQTSWNRIENLDRKTKLIVETKNGVIFKGKSDVVTSDSLNLVDSGKTKTLQRGEIAKIYLAKRSSRLKRALIGAAIGAGVGFGIGAVYTLATATNGLAAAGGFLYGLPGGAAIGALTGGKNKKGKLIYQAD